MFSALKGNQHLSRWIDLTDLNITQYTNIKKARDGIGMYYFMFYICVNMK